MKNGTMPRSTFPYAKLDLPLALNSDALKTDFAR
jgi:hypothetical protein